MTKDKAKTPSKWPGPPDLGTWEVIKVTEGDRIWYEVRCGALVITNGVSGGWKTPSEKRAIRMRDKLRRESSDRKSRREEVLP